MELTEEEKKGLALMSPKELEKTIHETMEETNREFEPLLRLAVDKEVERKLKAEKEAFWTKANETLEYLKRDWGILRANIDEARQSNEVLSKAIDKATVKTMTLNHLLVNTEEQKALIEKQSELVKRLTTIVEKIVKKHYPHYQV